MREGECLNRGSCGAELFPGRPKKLCLVEYASIGLLLCRQTLVSLGGLPKRSQDCRRTHSGRIKLMQVARKQRVVLPGPGSTPTKHDHVRQRRDPAGDSSARILGCNASRRDLNTKCKDPWLPCHCEMVVCMTSCGRLVVWGSKVSRHDRRGRNLKVDRAGFAEG